ncbi:MAG: CpXC domain-containing protein [Myxococcota bacterium]
MSTWDTHPIGCGSCGASFEVPLLKGMHITRLPEVKASIRDGTFQVFRCPGCGAATEVDRPSVYTDFDAGHYVGVEPRRGGDRDEAKRRHRAVYDHAFLLGPAAASELATRTVHRVVFGHRALREKVLAWDAGLDDVVVELAKALAFGRRVDSAEVRLIGLLPPGEHLWFAVYAHGTHPPVDHRVVLRSEYEGCLARREELRDAFPWVFDDWIVEASRGQ